MSPKRWRRAGIGLSIVWLLAAGYWANSAGLHRGDFAMTQYRACIENSVNPGNASGGCLEQFTRDYTTAIKGHWRQALMVGIIPIPLAWLLVYGLTGLRRRRRA
ncbi:MAG TPA: hypothetical protein VN685_01870 [Rhizomicrobium sp.]|nr:hypothetical protein [Rhizomicrobium sp.]